MRGFMAAARSLDNGYKVIIRPVRSVDNVVPRLVFQLIGICEDDAFEHFGDELIGCSRTYS